MELEKMKNNPVVQNENREKISERNLLTNYEETVDAIAEIEGQSWKEGQNRDGKTTLSALKKLQSLVPDPDRDLGMDVFTIYGMGGFNRYFVYPDGRIAFSDYQARRGDSDKARALGFKVF